MEWIDLVDEATYDDLLKERQAVVFKHSTRCPLSSMVKSRLGRAEGIGEPIYCVNLIKHRALSNYIEKTSGVNHASPQIIVFKEGQVAFHASHTAITADALKEYLE